jgi:ribonuclease HI
VKSNSYPINVYADGAYDAVRQIGAFAFEVPIFSHAGAGVEEAVGSTYFEVLAVISGIEWVLNNDASPRPIAVYSDCNFVYAWITELNARARGISKKQRLPNSPLIHRLRDILLRRPVICIRATSGNNPAHMRCHEQAQRVLKDGVPARAEKRKRDQGMMLWLGHA